MTAPMTIDAEKLEKALAFYDADGAGPHLSSIIAAARAHLATLPRYKEVEVECWALIKDGGRSLYCREKAAHDDAAIVGGTVVRLTGTAKVKVTP